MYNNRPFIPNYQVEGYIVFEFALLGHGEVKKDEYFKLPENCYVIMYSPVNYLLTTSAIEAISRKRNETNFNQLEDVEEFVTSINTVLDNADVKLYKPNDRMHAHLLSQLPDRVGVGSEDHKDQYKNAISRLAKKHIHLQDASSISRGQYRTVSLERTLKYFSQRAKARKMENQIQVFHWLACARDFTVKAAAGSTTCKTLSVTQAGLYAQNTTQMKPQAPANDLSVKMVA